MAKVKTDATRIAKELDQTQKLGMRDEFGKPLFVKCKACNRIKKSSEFLTCQSPENKTGFTYLCKSCCSMMSLDTDGYFNKQKVYELCKIIDKPFVNKIFESVDTMMNSTKTRPLDEQKKFAVYVCIINGTRSGYRTFGFDHSDTLTETSGKNTEEEDNSDCSPNLELWGEGWSVNELKQLNELYNEYLNNYPLRTAMHKMALVKICKLQLRYDTAIAQNNTNDAKYWGDLLSKAQTEAKFNPSQLSAADLSDGMTCFSQLSAVVEKAVDIIPLLPHFIEDPKDRVDYTLWEYINYARHLNGKPLCEYKDIYKFLNKRYESLKKRYKFIKQESDGNFDNDDIDN